MRIEVVPDGEALATRAARCAAEAIVRAVRERGRATVAFSGGRNAGRFFLALSRESVPWDLVEVFQVDERVAPEGSAHRNIELIHTHLLSEAPLSMENVHPMPVEMDDLAVGTERYADELFRRCGAPPVLDLVHLGLGEDGHTASLVPGDPVLDVRDRDVAITHPYRGYRRMTLTFPVLNRARNLLWVVEGTSKRAAVLQLVDAAPGIPAGRVAQAQALLVVDADAASRLADGA